MALANTKVPVELVLLSEIEVEPKFNCRTVIKTDEHEEKGGFDALRASIADKGQDTPVMLRRMPTKSGGKPYFLVTGFRRYAAIKANADVKGDKSPRIKAEIRDMTDAEARMLNVRENTARDDLSGADLCFGIGAIVESTPGGKDSIKQVPLAAALGMSQTYVGKLLSIWNKVDKKLLNAWRNPPNAVTMMQMYDISKLESKEEQHAAYEALRTKNAEKKDGRSADGWLDSAKGKCAAIGTLLGKLARDGALSIEHGEDGSFFDDNIRTLVSIKKDATEAQLSVIASAGHDAFQAAYDSDETAEEKEANEASGQTKRAEKKKSASKRKGANAHAN